MKAILFSCLLLLCSLLVSAQQFSPTTGVPCMNCLPTNYEVVYLNGGPWRSDIKYPGGVQTRSWNIPGFTELPVPPSSYSQGLPVGGGKNSFLTLRTSKGSSNDLVRLIVSGFDVNKEYKMKYHVLSGSVIDPPTQTVSPFGESAKLRITTVDQFPALVEEQITNFTSNNQNQWILKELTFQPLSSTLEFTLSGTQSTFVNGFVNFCIDKYPFDCQLPNKQVELSRSLIETPFPNDKLDLSTVAVKSVTPPTGELIWKVGPNSTDPTLTPQQAASVAVSNQDPANVKPYYAFYYAKDFNCYSATVSQAELKFNYVPTQVPLTKTYIAVSCADPKGNLTSALEYPDDDSRVVWFKTNDHQGEVVYNATQVDPGDYYAFYYSLSKGGYSLPANQVSTKQVKVGNPVNMPGIPDLGPTISINSLLFSANGSKDFTVKIHNIKAENSNCSVYFKVSKLPGFNITYSTQAGQSNGVPTNNDFWTFVESDSYITVTSKYGITASNYSVVGFNITRNAGTPAGAKQNLSITIPQPGGGGETNVSNNQTITTLTAD